LATPEKRQKSGIDQILTSACCPRQNEHTYIKTVAYNHIAAILQRCQKGKKKCRSSSSSSSSFSSSHFLFPRDFSETIADTNIINTPPKPFRPTDVPFVGYKTETKDLRGLFGSKIDFYYSRAI